MAAKKRSSRNRDTAASAGDGPGAGGAAPDAGHEPSKPTQPASGPSEAFPIIGIGCSAGGLAAMRKFLESMPTESGVALVMIQHLDPTRESLMAEILARHTAMPVIEVYERPEGVQIRPDHVYVIRPARELRMREGRLFLGEFREPRGQRRPIDTFFRSLAVEQKERAVAIVLTGTGTNGSEGLKAVKAEGGLVLAQEPETSEYDGMPRAAIKTGLVDFVLPVERMPELVLNYVAQPYVQRGTLPADEQTAWHHLNEILALINARAGHDFRAYKNGTLMRRIARRMGLRQIEALGEYTAFLRDHPDEVQNLVKDLLINVTSFFRDPEAWAVLEREVLEPLVRGREEHVPIRVWVPACSTGEESYTVAMLLAEYLESLNKQCPVKVFATDPGEQGLGYARSGIYPDSIELDIPPERLKRYFEKRDDSYQVVKQIREMVVYAPQNLLTDPPFSRLDLITCRNLLIYLEPEVQQRLLGLFHFALNEGGYLLLGNAETVGRQEDLFEPVSKKWRIYRKLGPTRHDRVDFPLIDAEVRREIARREGVPQRRRLGPAELIQQTLLTNFTPAAVLIDSRFQILHFHGDTDPFLRHPPGPPTRDLRTWVREGLLAKVRSAIHRAQQEGRRTTVTGGQVRHGMRTVKVAITAMPVGAGAGHDGLLLVSFQDESPGALIALREEPSQRAEGESQANLASEMRLEDELRSTREELESTIEELETSNEELKAANEEVTSINEELQSTNEELETSKEELQSLNEELNTVNHQLQAKLEELERSNNDLGTVLTSTDIAMLFLDTQYRIRRFTPATTGLFRLVPSDVGRPIGDLAQRYVDGDLQQDAEAVLDKLLPIEREVRSDDGRWYVRRIVPYRTEGRRIDGVVITFMEMTARKQAEEELRALNQTLEERVEQRTRSIRLLQEVSVIANEATSIGEALRLTLEQVCRHLGWPLGHAYLASESEPRRFMTSRIWYVDAPERHQAFVEAAEALEHSPGNDLVGAVIAGGRAEWIGDISSTHRLAGRELLTGHGIRSAAAFPIRVRDRVAGVLTFFDDEPAVQDELIMQGMDQVGTQLGRVIERVELEQEISRVSEEERRRFSHELHDGIAQHMTGLAMMAETLRHDLAAAASPLMGDAERLVIQARDVQRQVRNLARGLMPVEVDAEGLMAALQALTERTTAATGLACRFECAEPVRVESRTAATQLYYIAQEAVHNAVKHAHPREIRMRLEQDRSPAGGDVDVTVTVEDDGRGTSEPGADSSGMGRRIMQYRAGLIGAALEIRSEPGRGTSVSCRHRQRPEGSAT